MDKLQQIISGVSQDNIAAREVIYRHIMTNIIPTTPDVETRCPPLNVLAYTVRNIVHPTLKLNMTLDLLNNLAQIDCIRRKAVAQAQEALELNRMYVDQKGEAGGTPLSKADRKEVAAYAKEEKAAVQRDLYRTIVLFFCHLVSHSVPFTFT